MSLDHDPRHVARALALQHLFAELVAAQPVPEDQELLAELEQEAFDHDLRDKLIAGVRQTYQLIDPVIQELAPAWPITQIAPVDLIVLRMGIWEGFIAELNPLKVVINEMIELGKQFGGATSGSFINGVLGSLALRPELKDKLVQDIADQETPKAETIETEPTDLIQSTITSNESDSDNSDLGGGAEQAA